VNDPGATPPIRATTLRQSADQADELELVARVDGVPVSDATRKAIAAYIAARRADPEFQRRLRQLRDLFDRLEEQP